MLQKVLDELSQAGIMGCNNINTMTHTPNSLIESHAEAYEASFICRSSLDQIFLEL